MFYAHPGNNSTKKFQESLYSPQLLEFNLMNTQGKSRLCKSITLDFNDAVDR
jgi:hypothetical protein